MRKDRTIKSWDQTAKQIAIHPDREGAGTYTAKRKRVAGAVIGNLHIVDKYISVIAPADATEGCRHQGNRRIRRNCHIPEGDM